MAARVGRRHESSDRVYRVFRDRAGVEFVGT
jgi:hypothetical protein